jgi:hypothetical protein
MVVIGAFLGMMLILAIVRQMIKSKRAGTIYFSSLGIAFMLLMYIGLHDIIFDADLLEGWIKKIFVLSMSWVIGSIILIEIARKIIRLIIKYDTIFKPKTWILTGLWLSTLMGVFIVTGLLIIIGAMSQDHLSLKEARFHTPGKSVER